MTTKHCIFELSPFNVCGKVATHRRIAYWGVEFYCGEHAKVVERRDDAVVERIKEPRQGKDKLAGGGRGLRGNYVSARKA